jgi:hypothetical protein
LLEVFLLEEVLLPLLFLVEEVLLLLEEVLLMLLILLNMPLLLWLVEVDVVVGRENYRARNR